eukprot:4898112-Prymnesium_polylepis.1
MEERVRSLEQAEIELGNLAHRPASERNVTGEVRAGVAELHDHLDALPGMLAGELQPWKDAQERILNDE